MVTYFSSAEKIRNIFDANKKHPVAQFDRNACNFLFWCLADVISDDSQKFLFVGVLLQRIEFINLFLDTLRFDGFYDVVDAVGFESLKGKLVVRGTKNHHRANDWFAATLQNH